MRTAGVSAAVAFLLCLFAGGACADTKVPLDEWVRKHALPIRTVEPGPGNADLRPFKKLIGDARVFGFTEYNHGFHEWLALRNRVFQYLVEEAGVTAYAAESQLLGGFAIDDYVMGEGELTPDLVGYAYVPGTQHEENRQLIEWIRAYNARPTTRQPVRFYGLDVIGGRPECKRKVRVEEFEEETCADEEIPSPGDMLDYTLAYLENPRFESWPGLERISSKARELRKQMAPVLRNLNNQRRSLIRVDAWNHLSSVIRDTIDLLEAQRVELSDATSALAYARAYRAALTVQRMDAMLRSDGGNATWGDNRENRRSVRRDVGMAENLRWVIERENTRRGRTFVFMADGHLYLPQQLGGRAGGHARRIFGRDFITIGSLSFSSDDPVRNKEFREKFSPEDDTLSGLLGSVPLSIYLLDLREMPMHAASLTWRKWEYVPVPNAPEDSPWPPSHPANIHDAIVVIKQVTPAHPLKIQVAP